MASALALGGVPAARRAEGPLSCSARASRATVGGVRASGRPRHGHAPWHSATPPPRASTRARAFAVERGEALGDDDDVLAALFLEDAERSRRTLEAGDARRRAEPRARVRQRARLDEYCTLGIGGPARAAVEVYTIEQLAATLRFCASRRVPSVVIGKGSNVLFSDAGFDGVAIVNRVAFVEETPVRVPDGPRDGRRERARLFRVGAGTPFNALGASLSRRGWSGLEFAAGVPGTVGGAAFMNAGAEGQDTASVLRAVELVSPCGRHRRVARVRAADEAETDEAETDEAETDEAETTTTTRGRGRDGRDDADDATPRDDGELRLSADAFGYRRSPFMETDGDDADANGVAGWIVAAATFRLTRDPRAASRARAFTRRRRATQPLAARSVGCLFRNPGAGADSAGAAIDRAGLKNFAVGAARVSDRHANFLVVDRSIDSVGTETRDDDVGTDSGRRERSRERRDGRDMEALIAEVKARVLETTGLVLEEEVRRVPFRGRAKRSLADGGARGDGRKGPR